MRNRDVFAHGYAEAAVFADWPEEADDAEFAPGVLDRMIADAGAFYDVHADDIEDYAEGVEQAGHDLWFTRCGHGVGYWEQDGEAAARLDAAARDIGDAYLVVGDDGAVYYETEGR